MGGINKGQGEKERQGKKQQQEGIRIGQSSQKEPKESEWKQD